MTWLELINMKLSERKKAGKTASNGQKLKQVLTLIIYKAKPKPTLENIKKIKHKK